jgi:nucleotide-binding universal stress UspA family protein
MYDILTELFMRFCLYDIYMFFKNILVPYDGSQYAKHAFKIAFDLAKKYKSKITMISVLTEFSTGWWYIDSRIQEESFKTAPKILKKDFDGFESISKKAKVSFQSRILESVSPVKSLVSYAKSHKIDLIVMGSHGRTGWDKLVLGSVANGVSQRVRCPILIVK